MVKTNFRSSILSVLLIPYIFSMMGMFTSYFAFYYRSDFQSEVTSLNEDKLEVIVLSTNDFNTTKWTDGLKEFERSGKMFDVARIEQKGTLYYVYCQNDSLEDLLISYLKTVGSKTKCTIIFHALFIEPIPNLDNENCSIGLLTRIPFTANLYISVSAERNTPPPEFC